MRARARQAHHPYLPRPARIAAALLLAACGAEGPPAGTDGAVTVPPEAVQVLATLREVTRVVDLQPTSDGRVWVLNSMGPYFVVLGPSGQVERRLGLEGGGPEEFGNPLALVDASDGSEVWTFDYVRHALILISGDERRELALPADSLPISSLVTFRGAGVNAAPPWLESTDGGFLLAHARTTLPESALHLWNADILRVRADGQEASVEPYAQLADHLGDPASRFGDASVMLPYPLWTVCADGTVGLYDPLANSLRRLTPSGESVDSIALPPERRVQMTPDLVFDLFYRQLAEEAPAARIPPEEAMRSLTEEQNRAFVSSSSEFFPEYSELRCAPDGTLWLRLFDLANGRLGMGPDWLRFSPDGSRTLVALPRNFRTFRIDGERIWGTVRDSLGVESVAWVGVDILR